MQKHSMALAITVVSLLAGPARAQDAPAPSAPTPRVELFVGYEGQRPLGDTDRSGGLWRGRGMRLAVDWNFNQRVALVLNAPTLGIGYSSFSGSWVNYGFLVGPRFRFRAQQRVKPFIQLTAGVDHGSAFSEIAPTSLFEARERRTSFQSAAGAGLDISFGRKFAWRALQAEERSVSGAVEDRHRLSLSSGIVFSFGGRK
jgi:hypothetical protein